VETVVMVASNLVGVGSLTGVEASKLAVASPMGAQGTRHEGGWDRALFVVDMVSMGAVVTKVI
jgi:hypothetical protein